MQILNSFNLISIHDDHTHYKSSHNKKVCMPFQKFFKCPATLLPSAVPLKVARQIRKYAG